MATQENEGGRYAPQDENKFYMAKPLLKAGMEPVLWKWMDWREIRYNGNVFKDEEYSFDNPCPMSAFQQLCQYVMDILDEPEPDFFDIEDGFKDENNTGVNDNAQEHQHAGDGNLSSFADRTGQDLLFGQYHKYASG